MRQERQKTRTCHDAYILGGLEQAGHVVRPLDAQHHLRGQDDRQKEDDAGESSSFELLVQHDCYEEAESHDYGQITHHPHGGLDESADKGLINQESMAVVVPAYKRHGKAARTYLQIVEAVDDRLRERAEKEHERSDNKRQGEQHPLQVASPLQRYPQPQALCDLHSSTPHRGPLAKLSPSMTSSPIRTGSEL